MLCPGCGKEIPDGSKYCEMDIPVPEDFNGTHEEFNKCKKRLESISMINALIALIVAFIVGLQSSFWVGFFVWIITFGVLNFIIEWIMGRFLSFKKYNEYVLSKKKYDEWYNKHAEFIRREEERIEEEELEEKRKREDYWKSLSGIKFEEELSALYEKNGFDVYLTPTTGDDGVDIILRKDGKKIIVQCKAHKNPVGVEPARALYGALMHLKADNAILASRSGFTSGVFNFVRNKPITLVSLDEIIKMQSNQERIKSISENNSSSIAEE